MMIISKLYEENRLGFWNNCKFILEVKIMLVFFKQLKKQVFGKDIERIG